MPIGASPSTRALSVTKLGLGTPKITDLLGVTNSFLMKTFATPPRPVGLRLTQTRVPRLGRQRALISIYEVFSDRECMSEVSEKLKYISTFA